MSYSEQLKDPRWQKKRLEIMERDSFACALCMDEKSTLHVHYKKYEKGRAPWEYEAKYLITLCESCHEKQHNETPNNSKEIKKLKMEVSILFDKLIAQDKAYQTLWVSTQHYHDRLIESLFFGRFDMETLRVGMETLDSEDREAFLIERDLADKYFYSTYER